MDSFEPLAPEPQVAHRLAKGTEEKTQTQGDEEYGEREDENRKDAAPLISLTVVHAAPANKIMPVAISISRIVLVNSVTGWPKRFPGSLLLVSAGHRQLQTYMRPNAQTVELV